MKKYLLALSALLSVSAFAHEITGTPVLKGSLKTKIVVNTVETTCKFKVEKVRNLKVEDSFGNPGYSVRLQLNLDGQDHERKLKVKFDQEFVLANLFTVGNGTEVRDFEYFSEKGVKMNIDNGGRVKLISFPFENQIVTCSF